MEVSLLGHNHVHNADFIGDFPDASNGYLGLILKSKTIIRLNDKDINVPANSVIIYRQWTPRYYKADHEPFINDWFVFRLDDGDAEFFDALQIPLDTPITLRDVHLLSTLVQNMSYEHYNNNPYKVDTINCYLRIFFFKLVEAISVSKKEISGKLHDKMNMVYSKIHNLPYVTYSVDSLAEEATISPHYFQHLYKEMFDISPIRDMIVARVEYSKRFLSRSEMSIKTVAEACGYENDVHFMRQFKKVTGQTPSEYRNEQMNKEIIK